jgi:16S rRNA processing protein RimM
VSTAPDPTAVAVGDIVAAHALRGQVRVRAYQPPAPSLTADRVVLLEQSGTWREARILSAGRHGHGLLLVTLDGVTDRTAAEALIGSRVLVRRADLPPPEPDEFYHHDLLGFRVVTVEGRDLGAIVETMVTGLNDVWVVRDGSREHLIPVIADVVREIDRDGRRITIDPLPGLLD